MVTLTITGLEFHGKHGASAEERVVGCRYRADVRLSLDTQATSTDRMEDTVDYVSVATLVREVSDQNSCLTVERLATLCADAVLDQFPTVVDVSLEVSKLLPPTDHVMQSFSVATTRCRDHGRSGA
ncbi:MAG: dihydroneopterin aldolase [Fimbriimonadaceae bacterium]|nr:dihydroneopterin aldolase [Fimbriimonadaceae bacterium]